MELTKRERRIRSVFRVSVLLKAGHAFIEIVGGILLLFISPALITKFVTWVTYDDLLQDPHDMVANYLMHLAGDLSLSTTLFGAFYLLSHGVVKMILAVALLRSRLWAYPWSVWALVSFIVYQVYRYTITQSIFLILLTVFDIVVIWLIWAEYNIVKRHLHDDDETNISFPKETFSTRQ